MKRVKIEEAIAMAASGQSLEGVAIDDLGNTQVKARDVLLLAEFGIVIPEQNIYYDDEDVAYDADFDEAQWVKLASNISLEEQAKMVEDFKHAYEGAKSGANKISVDLELEDEEVVSWATANYDKIRHLLNRIVTDLYKARTIIEK